jgi:hypothetical protein
VVIAASWAGTYLPLIIAGAGVFVALFATLYRLRRDQQHWRGERRLDAYAEFIDSARTFLFLGDDVSHPDPDHPDDDPELVHRRQLAALRDEIRRLRQAVTKIRLLGPVPLADDAAEILNFYAHTLVHFTKRTQAPAERPAEVIEGAHLLRDWQDKAAEQLAIFRKAT